MKMGKYNEKKWTVTKKNNDGNEKEEVYRKEENSNERKSCNCNEQSRNGEAEFQPKGEDATTWKGSALRDYDDFVLGIRIGGIWGEKKASNDWYRQLLYNCPSKPRNTWTRWSGPHRVNAWLGWPCGGPTTGPTFVPLLLLYNCPSEPQHTWTLEILRLQPCSWFYWKRFVGK